MCSKVVRLTVLLVSCTKTLATIQKVNFPTYSHSQMASKDIALHRSHWKWLFILYFSECESKVLSTHKTINHVYQHYWVQYCWGVLLPQVLYYSDCQYIEKSVCKKTATILPYNLVTDKLHTQMNCCCNETLHSTHIQDSHMLNERVRVCVHPR